METCYRHPGRETGVSCSNCGRPDLPGLHDLDLGRHALPRVRGPEDEGQDDARSVSRADADLRADRDQRGRRAGHAVQRRRRDRRRGLAVAAQRRLGSRASPSSRASTGAWSRPGFLHAGLFHLLFNMFGLYILGGLLEPAIGRCASAILYFVSLLAGSFGALLLEPTRLTVGASGAIFGLMGAAVVVMRDRGINPMESGLGPVDRPEPADHLHDPQHLDRRPHRRPDRRRAGRVRDVRPARARAPARGGRPGARRRDRRGPVVGAVVVSASASGL